MPQPSTGILDPPLGSFVLTICPTKYSSQRKSINLTARGFGGRTRTSKFLAPPLASLRLPSCLLNSFVHSSPHTILSPLGTRLGGDTVAASAWLFATDSRCQIFSSWRLIFIESESIIQAWPAYTLLWIPKAHWTLHLAHDIWLWGPSRLLATFLNEMKNARFKAGAKRGNFHHPVKDVATFWAKQSDYELQSMPAVSHACVTSVEKSIIVSGTAASFSDSVAAGLLVKHSIVEPSTQLDFMSSFTFHGVPIYRQDHILFDTEVYMVHRLLQADSQYYMLLHEVAKSLALDDMDEYFVPVQHTVERPVRFVHVHSTCDITCFWAVPVESRLYLIPKI